MRDVKRGPLSFSTADNGVACERENIRTSVQRTEVHVGRGAESAFLAIGSRGQFGFEVVGQIDLDPASCRHLARLLDRAAISVETIVASADVQTGGIVCDPIPARYVPVIWRDMTPIDPATMTLGIGFTTSAEIDVFVRLPASELEKIACEARRYRSEMYSQSDKSSGASRSDVRSPDGTLKCEPTCASEAAERAS